MLGAVSERNRFGVPQASLAIALAAAAVFVTRDIWGQIAGVAVRSEEQSHILLAPMVAFWLFWVRRERLRFVRPRPTLVGPLIVAASWGLSVVGFGNGWDLFLHAGVIGMLVGALVSVVGLDPLRVFAPAFIALLFLLPVPGRIRQEIAIPLQEVSAQVTTWLLDLFGVPAARFGNVITVNGVDIAVAEACNGMRMVAALALVAYAFVFSTPMRNGVRLFLLAISPALALLVNIVRLVPTALWYGYGTAETAELFHDLAGWAMLVVALGLMWTVLALLKWIEVPIAPYAVADE